MDQLCHPAGRALTSDLFVKRFQQKNLIKQRFRSPHKAFQKDLINRIFRHEPHSVSL